MADYYMQFSESIENLNDEEAKWCEDHLLSVENWDGDLELRKLYDDIGYAPDFSWELIDDGATLWIYSEEYGNIDNAEAFVREFLRRFRPDDCFTLSWAATCSKPRIGDFSGGALFITAKRTHHIDAKSWAEERMMNWKTKRKSA